MTPQDIARGGKRALAAALSQIEAGFAEGAAEPATLALLDAAWSAPRGLALGLTGPPGVGKSTLAAALIGRLRAEGRTVGVVAVDPSSRRSGGALLGDRTRMRPDPGDAGVFIRSLAAGDSLGGLSAAAFPALVLLRALHDVVLVETVGVGQSETEVAGLADLTILCAEPGAGDGVQFMKAGVIEEPDLILVTKADAGPAALRTASEIAGALRLGAGPPVPVAAISARTGEGLAAVADLLRNCNRNEILRRRSEQALRWLEAAIRAGFGRFGLAAARPLPETAGAAPFAAFGTVSHRLRRRLQDLPLTD